MTGAALQNWWIGLLAASWWRGKTAGPHKLPTTGVKLLSTIFGNLPYVCIYVCSVSHCLGLTWGNTGSPGHTVMTSRHVIFALACQDCGFDHGFPVLWQGNSPITLACFSAIWSLSWLLKVFFWKLPRRQDSDQITEKKASLSSTISFRCLLDLFWMCFWDVFAMCVECLLDSS